MSQKTVQLLIGQLVTDEELRLRFVQEPEETLAWLCEQGIDLTPCEVDALADTDARVWDAMAARIDPRLQRCSIRATWLNQPVKKTH
jgi:hypothetical protein